MFRPQYCNPELGEEILVSFYEDSSNHSWAYGKHNRGRVFMRRRPLSSTR